MHLILSHFGTAFFFQDAILLILHFLSTVFCIYVSATGGIRLNNVNLR